MKKTKLDNTSEPLAKSRRPQDWRPEERLTALHKTYGLTGEALNAWCREHGVFIHQLEQWKAEFCNQSGAALYTTKHKI
jgi:hypothetical protein